MCSLVPAGSHAPSRPPFFSVLPRSMTASNSTPPQVINSKKACLKTAHGGGGSGASHPARSTFAEYHSQKYAALAVTSTCLDGNSYRTHVLQLRLDLPSTPDKQRKILLAHFVQTVRQVGYSHTNMARRQVADRAFRDSCMEHCCTTTTVAATADDVGTDNFCHFFVGST